MNTLIIFRQTELLKQLVYGRAIHNKSDWPAYITSSMYL